MKYRKKPVVIDAMQWFYSDCEDVLDWLRREDVNIYHNGDSMLIETLEGTMFVSDGDFIIQGVQGEFYPCKPDIFFETYEEV
jgi:hypothetical protein